MIGLTFVAGSTAACGKIGEVKAMFKFKQANQAYQGQYYDRSAALYEETIANNPNNQFVYFYLGNSYDNLYKPSEKGEAETTPSWTRPSRTTAGSREARCKRPDEAKIKSLALQYLMAAYGPDKLDDPGQGRAGHDPPDRAGAAEPANYFQLAKLYEDAGEYEAAEKVYMAAKDAKPADPAVYMQLASYYDRQGVFDKEIDGVRAARPAGTDQPRGLLHNRHPVLGSGLPRRGRERGGQERLRGEGYRGHRRGHPDQA